jgi:hypothetical protein
MKIDIHATKDLLYRHAKDIEQILREAGLQALREHARAGNLVASFEDGKVVLIDPRSIPGVDDDDSPTASPR